MNNEIKLLPEHIINQIKAGEVVESPATLLKELIENSIDAQSSKVEISVSDDLTSHIIIKDNGHGISKQNIHLAFTRHATSKIYQFNDIYKIYSFGFRGEALASIASISEIKCKTTCNGETLTVNVTNGNLIKIDEYKSTESPGTELHIKNIFHQTPARLKFIRSKTAEKNKLKKIVETFIISNPKITFILKIGENEKKYYPAISDTEPFATRALQLINGSRKKIKISDLYIKDFEYQKHNILMIANKNSSRGTGNKKQFLLANNRFFHDKKIHHLIVRKMNEFFWEQGQSGDYFCLINVPSEMMDPNVHPSKTEIKFIHHEYIVSGISSIIKPDSLHPTSTISKQKSLNTHQTNEKFEIEETYFYQNQNNGNSKESLSLFNEFIIIKDKDNEIQISYSKEILRLFLNDFFKNIEQYLARSTTLLIGVTFNSEELGKNINFSRIESQGFFLEKIQNNIWILKDIPEQLSVLPSNLIKNIVICINQNLDLSKIADEISTKHIKKVPISTIMACKDKINSTHLTRTLTKQDLESLFNND